MKARRAPARSALDVPAEVTKAELGALTGYSPKQLTRFVQTTDIPHRRDGNELYFPWPGVRAWLFRYLEEKGKRAAAPVDSKDALTRTDVARAELMEIELAKARGELMKVDDFERILSDAFGRARARLANLAPRVAAATFGAESVQAAQALAQPVIDEVFEELRRTDDVPTTEEDDGDDSGD